MPSAEDIIAKVVMPANSKNRKLSTKNMVIGILDPCSVDNYREFRRIFTISDISYNGGLENRFTFQN